MPASQQGQTCLVVLETGADSHDPAGVLLLHPVRGVNTLDDSGRAACAEHAVRQLPDW